MNKHLKNVYFIFKLFTLFSLLLVSNWLFFFNQDYVNQDLLIHLRLPETPILNFICITSLLSIPVIIFNTYLRLYFMCLSPLAIVSAISFVIFFILGTPLNKHGLAIISESNYYEIIEFLKSNYKFIIAGLFYVLIYLIIVFHLPRKINLNWSLKSLFILIAVGTFSSILILNSPNKAYYYHLRNNYYPFSTIEDFKELIDYYENINSYSEDTKNFKFYSELEKKIKKRIITVLVIGETSRYDHWQINGYKRKTSPLLGKKNDLISFSNVSASANLTYKAVPLIVTRATPSSYQKRLKEKSILAAFNEAGFKTFWISSHSKHFYNNSPISIYAQQADSTVFLLTNQGNGIPYDIDLVKSFKNIVQSTNDNSFIVIHTWGSHFNYQNRYPKEFEKFKVNNNLELLNDKNQLINSYDNSILYTDFVLNEIINIIDSKNQISSLLYIPDHGENLMDDEKKLVLHGRQLPNYFEIHIPMFLFLNSEYQLQKPQKLKELLSNKNKKISHENIFHSLLDLNSIKYPDQELYKSFSSSVFVESKKEVYISDSVFTYFDSLKKQKLTNDQLLNF